MVNIYRQVSQSDLNSSGNLSLYSAINYMQDCSFFHIMKQDALTTEFQKSNMAMFLISRQFNLLRDIKLGEKLKIVTWAYELNAFFGFRSTIIYDEAEKVCAESYAGGSFVDLGTGLPKRISEEVRSSLSIHQRYDMQYLSRKIRLPKVLPIQLDSFKVLKSHLDHYNHVNNARYISMATDLLPPEFKVKKGRVEYKKPAKLGNVIYPSYYVIEEGYTVVLTGDDKEIFSIIELKA